MSIFDKGFDPLQEIQRATKTVGEATVRIAEGASGVAVATGAAIVDAATTAGAAVAGAAGDAKAALEKKGPKDSMRRRRSTRPRCRKP